MKRTRHGSPWIRGAATLAACASWGAACAGTPPPHITAGARALVPCPSTPNCVLSLLREGPHAIEPIAYEGTLEEARDRLLAVLRDSKRCTIITVDERYVHAEFETLVFRFVDDVEFSFPEDEAVIHFRSASRMGSSDLGVNRRRMEGIRERFEEAGGESAGGAVR